MKEMYYDPFKESIMVTFRGYLRDFGGYRCICLYKTNIST